MYKCPACLAHLPQQGAAAAAAGRQGRRGAKASPEDAIETQTQEAGAEDGAADGKAAVSPTPSWMNEADAGQVRGSRVACSWAAWVMAMQGSWCACGQ